MMSPTSNEPGSPLIDPGTAKSAISWLAWGSNLLLEVFGALVLLAALRATVGGLHRPINSYDEGLLLTDANLLLMGKVPFRDFYSNYPPGIFLVLAGIWKVV